MSWCVDLRIELTKIMGNKVNTEFQPIKNVKIAATRIGCTWQEYFQNIQSGYKWCSTCKNWVLIEHFNQDSSNSDGKNKQCKKCSRAKYRRQYQPIPLEHQKPRGPKAAQPRDGDKKQARNKVNAEVRKGKLPYARNVPCTDCGHIGGDRQHDYDHFQGYDAANHLVVQCVCVPCHVKRELQRRKEKQEE